MGIVLDPSTVNFQKSLNSEIYVDKTMLIEILNSKVNTQDQYVCVSRPRRFGKSMAIQMIAAYYGKQESGHLFRGLKIEQSPSFSKYLNRYHVISLNVIDYVSMGEIVDDAIRNMVSDVAEELERSYPSASQYSKRGLPKMLEFIFSSTGEQFVFVIDEWDCIFRRNKEDEAGQRQYLDFLRNLLKDRSYVALAYMTGILPIRKYGEQSALNMFSEISVTDPEEYAEFTGFTEEEVKALCEKYQMSFEQTKSWYDGYYLREIRNGMPGSLSVFNPRSVVMAMTRHGYDNYWTKTETYEALKVYIRMNIDGLKDKVKRLIAGERVGVNTLKFNNTMTDLFSVDDVFTLLIHLGYLTYDYERKTCFVPNNEVMQEFINCIEDEEEWKPVIDAIQDSDELLKRTIAGDSEYVSKALEKVHQENTSILQYNDENALSCVVSFAYFCAKKKYLIKRELPEGKGYADLSFLPRKETDAPAMVVELKWNKSVRTALDQIRDREYGETFKEYFGDVLLVGINYDKESKQHECVIEKLVK